MVRSIALFAPFGDRDVGAWRFAKNPLLGERVASESEPGEGLRLDR
jgi:hypothetical protein